MAAGKPDRGVQVFLLPLNRDQLAQGVGALTEIPVVKGQRGEACAPSPRCS
jgi:hypothetical protein